MIDGLGVLAVIPARGGSKGVPRKNVREVGGKPLIAWTIDTARRSKYVDRLILSSDDAEIIAVARAHGCEAPFVRPAELARDETPGIDPVLHALDECPGYALVVLLQPTSPLRSPGDIDAALERCARGGTPACVSLCEAEPSPYWMYTLDAHNGLHPLLPGTPPPARRQDLPKAYVLNGAVYVARTGWLREHRSFLHADTAGLVMPPERSLDIDTETDLQLMNIRIQETPAWN